MRETIIVNKRTRNYDAEISQFAGCDKVQTRVKEKKLMVEVASEEEWPYQTIRPLEKDVYAMCSCKMVTEYGSKV